MGVVPEEAAEAAAGTSKGRMRLPMTSLLEFREGLSEVVMAAPVMLRGWGTRRMMPTGVKGPVGKC